MKGRGKREGKTERNANKIWEEIMNKRIERKTLEGRQKGKKERDKNEINK
jgi:hypothetical protein